MTRVFKGVLATLALCTGILASPAFALTVNWDIDPAQSSFKLAVPDQTVTLGTLTATMRLRNMNNSAWTTNQAPVDGLLASDVDLGGGTLQFLAGQSSMVGVNTGNYRPNPAAYNTAVTNTANTAGTFTNTSTGPGVFAARVNASVSIITINTGYISFDNVTYDLSSIVTAITGTSFLTNAMSIGVADSRINFDSVSTLTGIGDSQGQSGPISAVNTGGGAGSIINLGGNNYRITVPFNLPVAVSVGGVNLNATATGTLVGYAFIPEPATALMVTLGIGGLAAYGRRRRQS